MFSPLSVLITAIASAILWAELLYLGRFVYSRRILWVFFFFGSLVDLSLWDLMQCFRRSADHWRSLLCSVGKEQGSERCKPWECHKWSPQRQVGWYWKGLTVDMLLFWITNKVVTLSTARIHDELNSRGWALISLFMYIYICIDLIDLLSTLSIEIL